MSEVARVKVLEDVLLERERQDTAWDNKLYGYTHYIQLAAICFAMAEACQEEDTKNEKYS
tara:strand:+ start:166 stop:345 length:180 start_codon:yes stop_codon:yes gene_type:complete